MNHGVFYYSLLRYAHSQVLGEVINVGVLFIFPTQATVLFRYPARLQRLKHLYPGFSERPVKTYLQAFERKSRRVTEQWRARGDGLLQPTPDAFIEAEFLVSDDSALQFDPVRTGVLYSADVAQVAQDFYQSYFAPYVDAPVARSRHDEEYLLKQYWGLLRTRHGEIEKYLQPGITVASEATSLKTDLVWQNGTTNLVKSVGFDLTDADNINRKSVEFFGRLNLLSQVAEENHYRFDLLVSKPQDKRLYPAYQKALDILRSSSAPKEIIEESAFEQYSEKTANEVIKG